MRASRTFTGVIVPSRHIRWAKEAAAKPKGPAPPAASAVQALMQAPSLLPCGHVFTEDGLPIVADVEPN